MTFTWPHYSTWDVVRQNTYSSLKRSSRLAKLFKVIVMISACMKKEVRLIWKIKCMKKPWRILKLLWVLIKITPMFIITEAWAKSTFKARTWSMTHWKISSEQYNWGQSTSVSSMESVALIFKPKNIKKHWSTQTFVSPNIKTCKSFLFKGV